MEKYNRKYLNNSLISPLQWRKERKGKESLKPGTPERRRWLLFRSLVGNSLRSERKVKNFVLTGVLQEEAPHP